jgi:hypothetical protein
MGWGAERSRSLLSNNPYVADIELVLALDDLGSCRSGGILVQLFERLHQPMSGLIDFVGFVIFGFVILRRF